MSDFLAEFARYEDLVLRPYAVKSRNSLGRQYPEEPSFNRTCFERDRDRIIHSKSFRRLKHKTQVFVATESDHYRSRLIHTIEVSHISRHIARLLNVNEDLCEAIALAHDLGHTPFGHAGERELNKLMQPYGGFEHNKQSLRLVDELEKKHHLFNGLNLSFETRVGLMKHSTPWDNTELKTVFPSIEAQVVNLGDEIAYNSHDLDDGLSAKILDEIDLGENVQLWRDAKKIIEDKYVNLSSQQLFNLINSYLITSQINDVYDQSIKNINHLNIQTLQDVYSCHENIVSFSLEMSEKNAELRNYLCKSFYAHPSIYSMMKRGQFIINKLFNLYSSDPRLLAQEYQSSPRDICDYIAGMTDNFAEKEYKKLF